MKVDFYSIETDRIAYHNAKKNLKNDIKYVNLMYGKIVELDELPLVQDIDFKSFGFSSKNSCSFLFSDDSTIPLTSDDTSLSLV